MQTDTIDVWQVTARDLVTLGGEDTFTVVTAEDNGQSFALALRNDDGDVEVFHFMWNESIEIVVSLDDPVEDEVDSPL